MTLAVREDDIDMLTVEVTLGESVSDGFTEKLKVVERVKDARVDTDGVTLSEGDSLVEGVALAERVGDTEEL